MNSTFASNLELLDCLTHSSLAKLLIEKYPTLTEMAQAPTEELESIPGMGELQARKIKAAFALAERMTREVIPTKPLLDTPERVADLLREQARLSEVERFFVVLLNTRRRLIKVLPICEGTLDSVAVHPRNVFKMAITANASAIILTHNHPSGDPTPSNADIQVTRDIVRAGQLLKIEVLDHIVLGRSTADNPKDYYSLREGGYFYNDPGCSPN